eukprot:gene7570-biopygen3065
MVAGSSARMPVGFSGFCTGFTHFTAALCILPASGGCGLGGGGRVATRASSCSATPRQSAARCPAPRRCAAWCRGSMLPCAPFRAAQDVEGCARCACGLARYHRQGRRGEPQGCAHGLRGVLSTD